MRSYSPYESVTELLAVRSDRTPDAVAVDVLGQTRTYAGLWSRAGRVQGWLDDAGVRPGDHVALMMRNRVEFVETLAAISRLGAVAVPLNTSMIGDALHYVLEHSESVGLLADDDLFATVDRAHAGSRLRWRVGVGAEVAGVTPYAELVDGAFESRPHLVDALAPLGIIYTSGTTGPPKGVVLSHTSYLNTGAYFARHLGLTSEDVMHTCLPLFHCNAQQTTLMAGLHLGVPVHVDAKFSLSRFWSWIARSQATTTNLLGTMLSLLAKLPEDATERQKTLRYVVAAPVPEHLYEPLEQRWGLRIVEGYGLTETGTMACINPPSRAEPGTIGLPLEYNELMVVDDGDEPVADGVAGQLVTRTRIDGAYMTGYFKEPANTDEAMAGGWFHTGDLGLRRPDGYFVFVDRMKDTIRRRGENISSYFVEKAVTDHPDVLEAAAVGVPSELGEEDVKVLVVLRPGSSLASSDLSAWCDQALSDFMRPRYIEIREDFPRTETGRIHKYVLRAQGVGDAWDRDASLVQGGTGV